MSIFDNASDSFKPSNTATGVKAALLKGNVEEVVRSITGLDKLPDPIRKTALNGLLGDLNGQLESQLARRDYLRTKTAAFQIANDWLGRMIENVTLERNDSSRIHKLREASKNGRIFTISPTGEDVKDLLESHNSFRYWDHTFLVKHDWYGAMEGADLSGDIKLPFEFTAFEFRICGLTVVALAWDVEESRAVTGSKLGFTCIVECGESWVSYGGSKDDPDDKLIPFVWNQIRAICIALDAEVATHEVVRAPVTLNEKRVKAGKEPLRDYYIVDLSRRSRLRSLGGESGRKVRMHFRRGHWRHYEDHKTWIKWMLVGDPDLGFVGKKYAL